MRRFLLLIMLLCIIGPAFSQTSSITGKVTDQTGNPLAGATISVVGRSINATTEPDGTFSINLPSGAKQLQISYVGYGSQKISVGNQKNMSIELTPSDPNLSEVVVVAYGTVKKEALTGSIGTVKAADIAKRPIGNVTSAVEGAVPGVITSTTSGQPGEGLSIRVRGFGSINATSDPLFVVDGVPYVGNTSNLNPDDVESITVLKDAASSALYGSRAANGVVIITTKKGLKGRNNISVNVKQGFAQRGLAEYDRLDANQYYPIMWEAYRNSLVYPASGTGISLDSANRVASGLTGRTGIKSLLSYNPFNVPDNAIVGTDGKLNPNAQLLYADDLDWTKDLLRRGTRSDYSINFNGGGEKSDYFLSLGYVNEAGYTIKTDYKRYSARLNVNVQPKTWIKTGLNVSGNFSLSNVANDASSTTFVNPFYFSRNIGPIYPVYAHNMTTGEYLIDPLTGKKFWDLGNMGGASGVPNRPSGGFAGRQALAETSLNDNLYRRNVVSARNYVDIMFLKNFKFTNNISVDIQNQHRGTFENPLVGDGAPSGRASRDTRSSTALTLNQLLNYGKQFGDHRLDVLVGHETFNDYETDLYGFKQGQTSAGITELNNFTTISSLTSYVDRVHIESYLSRANYDYKSKYFVSASIRRDGNSRFAAESRWGTFWSVGAGWRLDKENFFENITAVDFLKLRGSYGVVGVAGTLGASDNDISYYASQGLYTFSNNANEPGIVQSQTQPLANPLLTWEINKQFDLGIDFGLFKNRISGSFEYYNRISSKLLFAVPQPLSSGVLNVTQNTATMYNRGIELNLNGDIIRTKNFIWNTNVNLSTVANKITKMPANVPTFIPTVISGANVSGTKQYAVGHSIFDYYLRTYYGVDPSDGAALYVAANTTTTSNRRILTNKEGGLDTLTTLASNGKFDYQGTSIPDLYGSFNQAITYKQFTLSALFTFQIGGKTFDATYQSLMSSGTYGGALSTDILKRWQQPGDVTTVPRLDPGRTTDFNANSSRWLVDASYLNIRTISLSYSLPKLLASKLNINTGQFYVSTENLAFFSKRKGMNNQQAFSGVTFNAYPPARIITGGITLNF